LPAAFKGLSVQLPDAFKGSIACGVQVFNCLRRSRVQLPAVFKGLSVQLPDAFKGLKGFGSWNLVLGIWNLEFPIYEVRFTIQDLGIWILVLP
jgi:hypothetical protein